MRSYSITNQKLHLKLHLILAKFSLKANPMEHFVETDISGFYVGSEGNIENYTGIKTFRSFNGHDEFVGLSFKGRRYTRRLSNLVYQFHINGGRPIPEDMTVRFRDGNTNNCRSENLYLDYRYVNRPILYSSGRGVSIIRRDRQ